MSHRNDSSTSNSESPDGGAGVGKHSDVRHALRAMGYQSVRLPGEDDWIPLRDVGNRFSTTDDTSVKLPGAGQKNAKLVDRSSGEVRGHARKSAPPSMILEHTYALQALLDESHRGAEKEITIIKRDENCEGRQMTYLSTRWRKIEKIKSRLPNHEYEACVVRLDDDLIFHVVTAPSDYFSPSEGLCYGENQVEKTAEERWG